VLRRGISTKKVPSKYDQFRPDRSSRTAARVRPFGVTVCRGTLTRLDEAFQGYFRRVKAGQAAPGYPRFKSASRWDSLSWCYLNGWKFEEGSRRLYIQGVGHVKLNIHRPLRERRRRSQFAGEAGISRPRCSALACPRPSSLPRQGDRDRPRCRSACGHLGGTFTSTLVTAESSLRPSPGHNGSGRGTGAARTATAGQVSRWLA